MHRRLPRRSFIASLVLLTPVMGISACSGGVSASVSAASGAPTTAGATGGDTTLDAITFTEDAAAKETMTVDVGKGGTLMATAGDGTTFTLDVPQGAVSRPTDITLTPLSDIAGIASATANHGVALGPDGSTFAVPLRLTITPKALASGSSPFMYVAKGDGSDVQPAVVDPASKSVVLLVSHFSTAGVAELPAGDDAALLRSQASDAAADLSARLAASTQLARQAQLLGQEDAGVDYGAYLEDFRTKVVEPRLAAAASSCEAATEAISTVTEYDRMRQLLGIDDAPTLTLDALQELDGGACEREAIQQCKDAQDPGILIAFWLGENRQRQLIGLDARHDVATIEADARQLCDAAHGFTVDPVSNTFEGSEAWGAPAGLFGPICDPSQPFTLKDGESDADGVATFTPDSTGMAGTVEYEAHQSIREATSSGTYTIETNGDTGHLHMELTGTWKLAKLSGTTSGSSEMDLLPLEPGDCE